ncbi:MAG: hypothetical protein JW955_22095 [Sedimentisphaerales bacterium]|nr:hypothetical protein [Sedimentisphaerales bacterium]
MKSNASCSASKSFRVVMLLATAMIAVGFAFPGDAEATLLHSKEDCTIGWQVTFTQMPLNCDECTGSGDATWYFSSTHTNPASESCADGTETHQENVGLNENAGQNHNSPALYSADMWSYGAVEDENEDCVPGANKFSAHFDCNVYNEYQTETDGAATVEEIWILKYGPFEILQDDVDAGAYTFTLSQSSTLSLQENMTLKTGVELEVSVEAAVGFQLEESYTETSSTQTSRDFVQADLGKHCGVFYYQTRIHQPVNYRHWTCGEGDSPSSIPEWEDGIAIQGTNRMPRVRTAATQAGILAIQDNGSLVSGSYTITKS